MADRIKTALVALPVLLALVILGGQPGTALVVGVAAYFGVDEYLRLMDGAFTAELRRAASVLGFLVVAAFMGPSALPAALLALGMLGYVLYEARHHEPSAQSLTRLGHVMAALTLVAFFLGHAVAIRSHGWAQLIFLMIIVMVGDSAAYFVGTAFGKHKLAPKLSPKKSIEGSLGGLAGAALCGGVFTAIFGMAQTPFQGVVVAMALNVAAQTGDLAESLLKRGAGVKDSGELFPGHGGMLDRVDSFLPTLPLYAAILALFGG